MMVTDAFLWSIAHGLFYNAIALWLLLNLGNSICRLFMNRIKNAPLTDDQRRPTDQSPPARDRQAGEIATIKAGRVIGNLERISLALGIIVGSWHILAAVIALKTVARFKKLDEQEFAEYFLIGSLFSLIWAIVVTGAWMAYDQSLGFNLLGSVRSLLKAAEACAAVCSQLM